MCYIDFMAKYYAQEKQVAFHFAEADEVLYGGAAGGGKSEAIVWDAASFCSANKNVKVSIFRRTYPELDKSIILRFREKYPTEEYEYNKQERRAYFKKSGSILEFNHCQHETDVIKFQSAEYERIYFDELTHFTEYQYDYLRSRNRTVKKNIKPQMKSATNPGGIGHLWVKKRFIDNALPNKLIKRKHPQTLTEYSTQYIPAKVYDNKYLVENDPSYINRLEMLPEEERKALLEGDWNVFKGQFFKEWRDEIHVLEPFKIPKGWKIFRAIDWGYRNPTCVVWLAVDNDGRMYVFKELYVSEKTDTEVVQMIKEMTEDEKKVAYTIADPSLWSVTQYEKGESIALRFSKMGISLVRGDNNRLSGASTFHSYLMPDATDKKPSLYFFNTCYNCIRTIPALIHDDKRPEDVNTDGEDHCLAGNTLVLTNNAWLPIKDIPYAKITGYDTIVIDIITSSGRKIICTPNHKMLTPSGWQEAGKLKTKDEILLLSQIPFKNSWEEDFTNAESIIPGNQKHLKEVIDYIKRSGSFTMAKFQKPIVSTTLTEKDQITKSQTLFLLKKEGIYPYIPFRQQKNKERQGVKTPFALPRLVMQNLPLNSVVEQLSSVGNERKIDKVYDLGVEHWSHCFVANGFIVHNCYDAIRYGLMGHPLPGKIKKEKEKHNTFNWFMKKKREAKDNQFYVGGI